jgi:hypothetical protein
MIMFDYLRFGVVEMVDEALSPTQVKIDIGWLESIDQFEREVCTRK